MNSFDDKKWLSKLCKISDCIKTITFSLQFEYVFDIAQAGVAPSSSSVSIVREEVIKNLITGPHYSDYYDPFDAEPAPGKNAAFICLNKHIELREKNSSFEKKLFSKIFLSDFNVALTRK